MGSQGGRERKEEIYRADYAEGVGNKDGEDGKATEPRRALRNTEGIRG